MRKNSALNLPMPIETSESAIHHSHFENINTAQLHQAASHKLVDELFLNP
jgi:hypothetical protein